MRFWYFLFIFSLLQSCSEGEKTLNVKSLELNRSYPSEDGENYFLVNPSDFLISENYIYSAEKDISHVVVLDRDFNFVKTIGKYGEGPEDFYHLGAFLAADSAIYLHDRGHGRLNAILGDVLVKEELKVHEATGSPNFTIRNGEELCYVIADGNPPIYCQNLINGAISRYGEYIQSANSENQRLSRSVGYLFSIDNSVVLVRPTETGIIVYNEAFEEMEKLDLSQLPILESSIALADETYNDPVRNNQRVLLFRDVYGFGNEIFILVYNRSVDEFGKVVTKSNHVLALRLEKGSIGLEAVYDLSEGNDHYSQLFVYGDDLYAFDPSAERIDKFLRR